MVDKFMELQTLEYNPQIITKPELLTKRVTRKDIMVKSSKVNPVFADIIEEAGQDVFDYLTRTGVTSKPNILFLSFTRHYLYDSEDLKNVGSIVNFKVVNRIANYRHYLLTMNRILSDDGLYAGCFFDYKTQRQSMMEGSHSLLKQLFLFLYRFLNRVIPRIPVLNKLQLLVNHGKVKCVTGNEFKELLITHGFEVIDMLEIEKLTYFVARKTGKTDPKTISLFTVINQFKTKSSVINT